MKKLYKRLPAPAADYSGVFAVLFEMDCLKVLHGQGGCTGNYCYADELRWIDGRKNVFHSAISEIEAITGNDRIVIGKIVRAQKDLECGFIAICGSPIPTVLGTDLRAVSRLIEKKTLCPVLPFDTHGLGRYDEGQRLAYETLFERFAVSPHGQETPDVPGSGKAVGEGMKTVNVIGATPLDGWSREMADDLTAILMEEGYEKVHIWGMGADVAEIAASGSSALNIAVSVSGISTVRRMQSLYGTDFRTGFPIRPEDGETAGAGGREKKRVCILTEQFTGNAIRKCLRTWFGFVKADVVSLFMMDNEFMEEGDAHVRYEEDLEQLLEEREKYDLVIGDAFLSRFFPKDQCFIAIPYPAVSAHNNTPYITEYSYEPHLAMVCGEYNTPKLVNLAGEKGYLFLKEKIENL